MQAGCWLSGTPPGWRNHDGVVIRRYFVPNYLARKVLIIDEMGYLERDSVDTWCSFHGC